MYFSTGSLVDYLKTQEGSNLPMNTLIDMSAQARFLLFLEQLLSLRFLDSHLVLSLPLLRVRSFWVKTNKKKQLL